MPISQCLHCENGSLAGDLYCFGNLSLLYFPQVGKVKLTTTIVRLALSTIPTTKWTNKLFVYTYQLMVTMSGVKDQNTSYFNLTLLM